MRKIIIEDKKLIDDYLNSSFYRTYQGSELLSQTIFTWYVDSLIEVNDESMFIKTKDGYLIYVKKSTDILKCIQKIKAKDNKARIIGLTKEYLIPELDYIKDRNKFEYIYQSASLINLSGGFLKPKRNNVNKFKKNHHYQIKKYNDENFNEAINVFSLWNEGKTITSEVDAFKNALTYYKLLDFIIDEIFVDEKMIAIEIGCAKGTIGYVFFEKADKYFPGVFQAINQFFSERNFSHLPYINRQEDLGIPGLRISKESYNPLYMVEKYYYE